MITAINPITFTRDVFSGYTEFLTDFISFKDKSLMDQFKREIAFDLVSGSRIIKGPYVKLNRPFLTGHSLQELAPQYELPKILYDKFPFPLYKHQQDAFEHLFAGHNLVVSTGTGSGKTEAFLIPIIARLLNLQHEGKLKGLHAILVYPMNALANDQLARLRKILAGTGITFGRYTGETKRGKTPDDVRVLPPGTQKVSEADKVAMEYGTLVPSEEMLTRDQIQQTPPNILITNYMQLEYLLLRGKDIPIFDSAPVEFVVMDEMHTYIGEQGSEVAALLRRLKCLCANPEQIRFVGTSATVASGSVEEMTGSVSRFASRLFGVKESSVKCVFEQFKAFDKLTAKDMPLVKPEPKVPVAELLSQLVTHSSLDQDDIDPGQLYQLYRQLSGFNGTDEACHDSFMRNPIVVDLMLKYTRPGLVSNAIATIRSFRPDVSDEEALAEVYCYLLLGLLLHDDEGEPLLRPNLHFFFKGVHDLRMSYENGQRVLSLNASTRRVSFDLYNCRICGMHYLKGEYEAGLDDGDCPYYELSTDPESSRSIYFTDNSDFITDDEKQPYMLCEDCGTLHFGEQVRECKVCRSRGLLEVYLMDVSDRTMRCCACGTKLGDAQDGEKSRNLIQAASREPVDLTIALENMLSNANNPKAIVFVDNRQEAAFLSGYLKVASRRFVLRDRLHSFFEQGEEYYSLSELPEQFYDYLCNIGDLVPPKAKGKRKVFSSEDYTQIEWFLHEEFCSDVRTIKRRSLEKLGLLKVVYDGVNLDDERYEGYQVFLEDWSEKLNRSQAWVQAYCVLLLDYLRSHSVLSQIAMKLFFNKNAQKVRNQLNIPQFFRIDPIALQPTPDSTIRSFLSMNGRSYAQVLAKKMLTPDMPGDFVEEAFFSDLFSLFVKMDLIKRFKDGFYLNPEKIFVDDVEQSVKITKESLVCSKCAEVYSPGIFEGIDMNELPCPTYNCKGELVLQSEALDNYDRRRYLSDKERFEMKPAEHTGQIERHQRSDIEKKFKSGDLNLLIATSTLELGIDIGDLDLVMMRNVPPSPANYDQRSGRAGRRHRIAVNSTYCGSSTHDTMFFDTPEEMINGEIKTPTFSMRNYPLLQKHVHSLIFTTLMRLSTDGRVISEVEKEQINAVFPKHLNGYFPELSEQDPIGAMWGKRDFSAALKKVIHQYKETLTAELLNFFRYWDGEDLNILCHYLNISNLNELADHFLKEISTSLDVVLRDVRDKYLYWNKKAQELNKKRKPYNPYNKVLSAFENPSAASDSSRRFLTIGYLRESGFLPGYNLVQPGITASRIPEPDISRPVQIALREYAPFSLVYADSRIYTIQQYYLESTELPDKIKDVVIETEDRSTQYRAIRLTDLELKTGRDITRDDMGRTIRSYEIQGAFFENATHLGGKTCPKGRYTLDYYRSGSLELYNTHMMYNGQTHHFYICPKCGWVYNYMEEEKNKSYLEHHMKKAHNDERKQDFSILYTPFTSDVLRIRSFSEKAQAVNVAEAIRRGAMKAADMEETDIDYFVGYDVNGYYTLIYENVPGGSGFVEHIFTHFDTIKQVAIGHLLSCTCGTSRNNPQKACYKCLLSFWNQYNHKYMDRELAAQLLSEFTDNSQALEIPPNSSKTEDSRDTDSTFEDAFYNHLKGLNVPLPKKQYNPRELNTVMDFAYPDQKIAIYIDGEPYHRDRKQQDSQIRMALKTLGWKVIVFNEENWNDESQRDLELKRLFELLS